jgi:hypothetical protein
MKTSPHGWHIWQTFVKCRYLPRLGNAALIPTLATCPFPSDVRSKWHKPNSRIFVVYTCCCIPTTPLHKTAGDIQYYLVRPETFSVARYVEGPNTSHCNAIRKARVPSGKCTLVRLFCQINQSWKRYELPSRLAVQCTIVGAYVIHSSRGNVAFPEYHFSDDKNWSSLLSCQHQSGCGHCLSWPTQNLQCNIQIIAVPACASTDPNCSMSFFTTFRLPKDNEVLRPQMSTTPGRLICLKVWEGERQGLSLYKLTECCRKDADKENPGSVSSPSPQIARELASNLTQAPGD